MLEEFITQGKTVGDFFIKSKKYLNKCLNISKCSRIFILLDDEKQRSPSAHSSKDSIYIIGEIAYYHENGKFIPHPIQKNNKDKLLKIGGGVRRKYINRRDENFEEALSLICDYTCNYKDTIQEYKMSASKLVSSDTVKDMIALASSTVAPYSYATDLERRLATEILTNPCASMHSGSYSNTVLFAVRKLIPGNHENERAKLKLSNAYQALIFLEKIKLTVPRSITNELREEIKPEREVSSY